MGRLRMRQKIEESFPLSFNRTEVQERSTEYGHRFIEGLERELLDDLIEIQEILFCFVE